MEQLIKNLSKAWILGMNPSKVDLSLKCLQSLAGNCIFQVLSLEFPQTWSRSSDSLWAFFPTSHRISPPSSGKAEFAFSKDGQHGQAKSVSWPSCSWGKTHQSSQRLACFVRQFWAGVHVVQESNLLWSIMQRIKSCCTCSYTPAVHLSTGKSFSMCWPC